MNEVNYNSYVFLLVFHSLYFGLVSWDPQIFLVPRPTGAGAPYGRAPTAQAPTVRSDGLYRREIMMRNGNRYCRYPYSWTEE